MNYVNPTNIPLPLAVFLATDDYDYEPNVVSTTTLLRPIRQLVLSKRVEAEDRYVDIGSLISSRMGTAIHSAIEKAWTNPHPTLKALGYPDKVINRIKVNPETVNPDDIPVYMEQRTYRDIMGYRVSGKPDFIAEGKVQDFKSTSVYNYLNQSNREKYILQGSIYRWLNPKIITKDEMIIHYIFTDWNKLESLKNKEYPTQRVLSQTLPLLSLAETESFIRNKLEALSKYKNTPEPEIPLCTDEELWRKPDQYKYYKNPENQTRSTKNFDNYAEAYTKYIEDGSIGLVKTVKGQVSACKYCPAFSICSQRDSLIQTGDLIL